MKILFIKLPPKERQISNQYLKSCQVILTFLLDDFCLMVPLNSRIFFKVVVSYGCLDLRSQLLHKKWSFQLRIPLVNVTKSAGTAELVTFTEEILNGKFLCSVLLQPFLPFINLFTFPGQVKYNVFVKILLKVVYKSHFRTFLWTMNFSNFFFKKVTDWCSEWVLNTFRCFEHKNKSLIYQKLIKIKKCLWS